LPDSGTRGAETVASMTGREVEAGAGPAEPARRMRAAVAIGAVIAWRHPPHFAKRAKRTGKGP
ncbi:MAG: hypothetical protein OXC66_09905, partial [Roseovarius sp.]|nr:hypothetical protein [Roseovarius sp.]